MVWVFFSSLFENLALMFSKVENVAVKLTKHAVSAYLVFDDFLFYKDPITDET